MALQMPFVELDALHSSANFNEVTSMKSIVRIAVLVATLYLGFAIPAMAQIATGITFTADFPFYAQNARMPAGTYRISQTDISSDELLIESADGKYSVFVDFNPTHAEQPHQHSDVTFHKYGSVDYLNRVWVSGQRYGLKVEPTKAEQKAATSTRVIEHTIEGN